MAGPRAVSVVTNPPGSAGVPTPLSVALSVAFDVADADDFDVGDTIYTYPQLSPRVTLISQYVALYVTAVSGHTVTATVQDVPTGRTIAFGDVVDGLMPAPFSTIRNVDGVHFARTATGVRAAIALGSGEVYIPPGPDIEVDRFNGKYAFIFPAGVDDLHVVSHPSVHWNLPSGAECQMFACDGIDGSLGQVALNATAGVAATVSGLVGGVYLAGSSVRVTDANYATLNAAGTALGFPATEGAMVKVVQNNTGANYDDFTLYAGKITAIDTTTDAANTQIVIDVAPPKPFTVALSASISIIRAKKRCSVTGISAYNPNGNTGLHNIIVGHQFTEDFRAENLYGSGFSGSVYSADGANIRTHVDGVKAVNCGVLLDGYGGINISSAFMGTFDNLITTDCWQGIRMERCAWCQGTNWQSNATYARAIKLNSCWNNTIANLTATGSGALTGLCVSGDSQRNVFNGIVVAGNADAGIITAQVPGGLNAVSNNQFLGIVAHNNSWVGGVGYDCVVSDVADVGNVFEGLYGTFLDSAAAAGHNSFIGRSIPITFAAGSFTADGGGAWTLTSPDQVTLSYTMLSPTLMMITGKLVTTTVATATPTNLMIALPNGRVAAEAVSVPGIGSYSTGPALPLVPLVYVVATGTVVALQRDVIGTAWALDADHTFVGFQITIPVNR